jgi:hypothetical protein
MNPPVFSSVAAAAAAAAAACQRKSSADSTLMCVELGERIGELSHGVGAEGG